MSNLGLSKVIEQVDVENFNARLSTMSHLISCAERHDEGDVARSLTETMDGFIQTSVIPIAA